MLIPPPAVLKELSRAVSIGAVQLTEADELRRLRAENVLLEKENTLFRHLLDSISPHRSLPWPEWLRKSALELMRLRGEGIERFSRQIGVAKSTIQRWKRGERAATGGSSAPPNKLSDSVRGAVHALRHLCPETDIGSRTLRKFLVRHGIEISRAAIQQILREPPPPPLAPPDEPKAPQEKPIEQKAPQPIKPYGPLAPEAKNEVWHLDLTTIRIFWARFTVAALMDGKTRKCLALDLFAAVPGTEELLAMVEATANKHGKPGMVLTDRGGQFQTSFSQGLLDLGIDHFLGRLRRPQFNGKLERMFRTLKFAFRNRLVWFPHEYAKLQEQLDAWRAWYNGERPHQALGNLTPDEAWRGVNLPQAISYRANDYHQPEIRLSRHDLGRLVCCPVIHAEVRIAA